jgi:hypothetical protein
VARFVPCFQEVSEKVGRRGALRLSTDPLFFCSAAWLVCLAGEESGWGGIRVDFRNWHASRQFRKIGRFERCKIRFS